MAPVNSNFPNFPLLAPLALAYGAAAALHRQWMRMSSRSSRGAHEPRIPLVVVGALRAGGSGKTGVTAALARWARSRDLRVAILAYRLGPGPRSAGRAKVPDPLPVPPDADWRESSEEAVLLARLTGAPVFATRQRNRAWRVLATAGPEAGGPFDLVLSDDGFQDLRLTGAFRLLLMPPGERPGAFDLLPAGPYRETWKARARAHLVVAGPLPMTASLDNAPATGCPAETSWFARRPVLPAGLPPGPRLALCALGDNRRFLAEIAASGAAPAASLFLPDHAAPAEADLEALARRIPGAPILCTRKDAVKLEAPWARRFPIFPVEEEVLLGESVLAAVSAHIARSPRRRDTGTSGASPSRP